MFSCREFCLSEGARVCRHDAVADLASLRARKPKKLGRKGAVLLTTSALMLWIGAMPGWAAQTTTTKKPRPKANGTATVTTRVGKAPTRQVRFRQPTTPTTQSGPLVTSFVIASTPPVAPTPTTTAKPRRATTTVNTIGSLTITSTSNRNSQPATTGSTASPTSPATTVTVPSTEPIATQPPTTVAPTLPVRVAVSTQSRTATSSSAVRRAVGVEAETIDQVTVKTPVTALSIAPLPPSTSAVANDANRVQVSAVVEDVVAKPEPTTTTTSSAVTTTSRPKTKTVASAGSQKLAAPVAKTSGKVATKSSSKTPLKTAAKTSN